MQKTFVRTCIKTVGALSLGMAAATAAVAAEPVAATATPGDDLWTATTHVGFAVEDQSTTGFQSVGGSLFFLDLTHQVEPGIALGLRTLGQGGHGAQGTQYYRLAAGPMASWKINDAWTLEMAVGRFEESGLDASGGRLYQSTGVSSQIGWERVWTLTNLVEVAWGGFVGQHQGSYHAAAATRVESVANANLNIGLSHGLEAALRMRL